MTTSVNDILAEREKTHGSYAEHAEISNVVFEFWASRPGYKKLTHDQRETLKMIAHKVGRVLAGNAEFADHWDDVAGYATLSGNLIRGRTNKDGKINPVTYEFFRNHCLPFNIRSMEDFIRKHPNAGLQELKDYHDNLRYAEPT